ncbi:MAG: hypothetical protein RBJ76_14120 [Stenomitos frigidus ULC029]
MPIALVKSGALATSVLPKVVCKSDSQWLKALGVDAPQWQFHSFSAEAMIKTIL